MNPETKLSIKGRMLKCWLNELLPIGPRSVLFGTHCWFIHPFFVALGWWKLYGMPRGIYLWTAFFLHDLGYLLQWCRNMDGPEGETHVVGGARLMKKFVEWHYPRANYYRHLSPGEMENRVRVYSNYWYGMCLYHSRYYAKAHSVRPSQLCMADKLAPALEPWWLYLPRTKASGELAEYMENAKKRAASNEALTLDEKIDLLSGDERRWFRGFTQYMRRYVREYKDGGEDTWTAKMK